VIYGVGCINVYHMNIWCILPNLVDYEEILFMILTSWLS